MASKYGYLKEFNRRVKNNKKRCDILRVSSLARDNIVVPIRKVDSNITRIRNRCLITGCSRGVINKYKIGRIYLKTAARAGWLNGVRKSSW